MNESLTSVYGDALAYKVVKSFIESPGNYAEVEGFVEPDMFADAGIGLDVLVKSIKNYYKEKGEVPGYEDLEYYIKNTVHDKGDLNAASIAFKKVKDDKMANGIDTAAEVGISFLKKMEAVRQLKNAKVSVEKSGYSVERICRIIEGLQEIEGSVTQDDEFDPVSMRDAVFNEDPEERIPTGLEDLDKHINGGVPKGTTALLLAGTGVGKTTLMSIMGLRAALSGYKVLYLLFEDKNTDFTRKFYAGLTNRYTKDFIKTSPYFNQAMAEVDELLKNEKISKSLKNLKVKKLRNGETTVDNIKTCIRRFELQGFKPDVVFLDYLHCIKPSSDNRTAVEKLYDAQDRAMKRLDAFAQEENFALWVAQQFNREGGDINTPYQRIRNIQASYAVTQTASIILCLLKNTEDTDDYNRVDIYLDKCRYSPPAKWEDSYLNNGTCQVELNGNTFETIVEKDDDEELF